MGYYWLSQSLFSDLVVIDTLGIEFYKLFPKLSKILTVKGYQLPIGHYWYEGTEGVIVVASSPPKLGQFSTFFVNQNKGAKFFNGQRFICDLTPSVTDKWTESPPNIASLVGISEVAAGSSPHSVSLAYFYGCTYFIHVQCQTGKLILFKLTHEKITKSEENMQFPVGQYGIRILDNLLILQNYSLQESYIVDIRSGKYQNKAFFTFWNSMKESLPEVSVKISPDKFDKNGLVETRFFYDKRIIGNIALCKDIRSLNGAGAECAHPLDSSLLYIDKDICIDTTQGRCYKLTLQVPSILTHPDKTETILFLLRRKDCKLIAFNYLKISIRNSISLSNLSNFFAIIGGFYKVAALEKKNRTQTIGKFPSFTRKPSSSSESDFKVEEGMIVLLQSDVFSLIFQALYEDGTVNLLYLSQCIQEYIRSLVMQDIQVQQNLYMLLIKVLIKGKYIERLKQLLQYRVVPDSLELAGLLVSDPKSFQLAVDMMFRLKTFDKLVDVLIEKDFVFEAMKTMGYKNPQKVDIMKVISKCQQENNGQVLVMITQLIKEWAMLNS